MRKEEAVNKEAGWMPRGQLDPNMERGVRKGIWSLPKRLEGMETCKWQESPDLRDARISVR